MHSTRPPYHKTSHSVKNRSTELFCNNCGKYGHVFHICKLPITSIGIICFRFNETINELEFLMICRKDTLGFTDFMRGKFSGHQKFYILNMIKQMTNTEKGFLLKKYWQIKHQKASPESLKDSILQLIHGIHNEIGEIYDLKDLLEESEYYTCWKEPEWGFPKGRRNAQESDYECAIREFTEETGYNMAHMKNVRNIMPFEEVFTGSNYNSYRHKYYIMNIPFEHTIKSHNYQKTEVSKMEWKTYKQCLELIRPYNLEKKKVLTNVYECLNNTTMYSTYGSRNGIELD